MKISELSQIPKVTDAEMKKLFPAPQVRDVTIYLTPLRWQLWPVWSKRDPTRISLGPLLITWSRC